ncbi:Hsp20/alpha crystallin family protein [Natronorubrum aibiense]|uniref:Hsp20/alpha crystallin family protein n=1 Tax=Natronorubrum aibiense TaxID=348826 RepID=A0A5P9NYR1_9EURY|nr:Hsp20/alpha crystallin family protein [Natronorubrum aibiense]QFU81052.1 Hsp20/alpha crystallin family protein [Natronorubrum aibiense]
MTLEQFSTEAGQIARQYEYDECSVLAVDFGVAEADAAVDLVDDTVIVVDSADRRSVDRSDGESPEGGHQYEIDLPDGVDDAHTFMKNGVLTVEMEGDL